MFKLHHLGKCIQMNYSVLLKIKGHNLHVQKNYTKYLNIQNIPKLETAVMKYAYCLMVAHHINKSKAKMQYDRK